MRPSQRLTVAACSAEAPGSHRGAAPPCILAAAGIPTTATVGSSTTSAVLQVVTTSRNRTESALWMFLGRPELLRLRMRQVITTIRELLRSTIKHYASQLMALGGLDTLPPPS